MIERFIIGLILLLTLWGIVDCWRTMKLLKRDDEELYRYGDTTVPRKGAYLEDGLLTDEEEQGDGQTKENEQEELLNDLKKQETTREGLTLTEQRLVVILRSVQKGNAVRKLPSFTSLRALNRQQSYAQHLPVLRIIIPLLLVLGIAGTLVGVHDALEQVSLKEDIRVLLALISGALYPGMLATIFTVILIACRAYYYFRFNRFMKKLDNMTLCAFLPALQIRSHQQEAMDLFVSKIDNVREFRNYYETTHQSLRLGFTAAQRVNAVLRDHFLTACKDISFLSELLNTLNTCRAELATVQERWASTVAVLIGKVTEQQNSLALVESMLQWQPHASDSSEKWNRAWRALQNALPQGARNSQELQELQQHFLSLSLASSINQAIEKLLLYLKAKLQDLESLYNNLAAVEEQVGLLHKQTVYFEQSLPSLKHLANRLSIELNEEDLSMRHAKASHNLMQSHSHLSEVASKAANQVQQVIKVLSFWKYIQVRCSMLFRWATERLTRWFMRVRFAFAILTLLGCAILTLVFFREDAAAPAPAPGLAEESATLFSSEMLQAPSYDEFNEQAFEKLLLNFPEQLYIYPLPTSPQAAPHGLQSEPPLQSR